MTEKKKDTTPKYVGPGVDISIKEEGKKEEECLSVQICGRWYVCSPTDPKSRKILNLGTKKRWLADLFAGADWHTGEVCKSCYSDMPIWVFRGGVEQCAYCRAPKNGNTIAPWEIPRDKLKRLMEERVWKNVETVSLNRGGVTRGQEER